MTASVRSLLVSAALCAIASSPTTAFQLPSSSSVNVSVARANIMALSSTAAGTAGSSSSTNEGSISKSHLYVPSERDERYQGDVAQYLLDLDEEGATFDFCGGMMFQLVLSDKLKSHLGTVASSKDDQPIIHPASQPLMNRIPDYQKSALADNISVFHGRELRKIPTANGGMGFVLQLSYADPSGVSVEGAAAGKGADAAWNGKALDPQGWSAEEIATYDGWRSDSFRQWRKCSVYEAEGYGTFSKEFGDDAFGLNHRFFLHSDGQSRMWLSAEDGCEGTPAEARSLMGRLGGMLFGQ